MVKKNIKRVRLELDPDIESAIITAMINNKEIEMVIDHLTQASYNANRNLGESPERLALVFGKKEVALMETKFQKCLTIAQK
jgi:3-polyprenyl-4-hydroxybenzoate decarboxylase